MLFWVHERGERERERERNERKREWNEKEKKDQEPYLTVCCGAMMYEQRENSSRSKTNTFPSAVPR